jgi:hypothetical protein
MHQTGGIFLFFCPGEILPEISDALLGFAPATRATPVLITTDYLYE